MKVNLRKKLNKKSNIGIEIAKIATYIFILMCFCPYVMEKLKGIGILTVISLFCFGVLLSGDFHKIIKTYFFTLICLGFSIILYFAKWTYYGNMLGRVISLFLFFFPLIIANFFYDYKNKEFSKNILILFIATNTFTAFTTMIALWLNPLLSRALGTGQEVVHTAFNVGTYNNIYGFILFMPIMIYLIKKEKNLILLCALALQCYTILLSQYTMAILMMIVLLILFAIDVSKSKNLVIPIAVGITLNLIQEQIGLFILKIEKSIQSSTVKERINELAFILLGKNTSGDVNTRFELYKKSLNTFLNEPIFGNWVNSNSQFTVGEHSEWLDMLGLIGIVGTCTFIGIIYMLFKPIYVQIPKGEKRNIVIIVLAVFTIFGFVNTGFSNTLSSICFLLPYTLIGDTYENTLVN